MMQMLAMVTLGQQTIQNTIWTTLRKIDFPPRAYDAIVVSV